ncbi:MAG TPA: hypothetical protein P5526_30920 [Anaerolineae bacterium]|nr:hypothetical protein [Anaerolineae bacterium]
MLHCSELRSNRIVCGDSHSLDRTVDDLVSFDQGQSDPRYPTPFASYQRLREKAQRLEASAAPDKVAAGEPERRCRSLRKLSYKEQREIEAEFQQVEPNLRWYWSAG